MLQYVKKKPAVVVTFLSARYMLAFVTFRKQFDRELCLFHVYFICWEFFLIGGRVYCAKLNLCLKKKVYHIGVHIVQSNSTFQHH